MSEIPRPRRSSIFLPIKELDYSVPHDRAPDDEDAQSDISVYSFRRWHKLMQIEHERMRRSSFTLWKCCIKVCRPCRWFDSIEYDKNICKCCLKFKTFKSLGTIFIIAVFFYTFMYSVLKDEVLPGGTIFFLFVLFFIAYVAGYVFMLIGWPPMIGHLAIGITFGNIPNYVLPGRDDEMVEEIAKNVEKVYLILALIRAGLLLDLSRIKDCICFILELAALPFFAEFGIVWAAGHFLLGLPWEWSALQGSVLGIVSLATVTSVMVQNKQMGYGEDKHLSTVLIATSVLNVIFGVLLYAICMTCTVPIKNSGHSIARIIMIFLEETAIGVSMGGVGGILIAFFPDKHSDQAAAVRILIIGIGSFAIANVLAEMYMPAAGVIGCLTLCIVAANMWKEIGWHSENNPVQYFYTMAYYFGQPVVLSLVGYTMHFNDRNTKEVGISIAVILLGIASRETICLVVTSKSRSYPTNMKERIFICIAWFSKGTFQALLALAIMYMTKENKNKFDSVTFKLFMEYSKKIRETAILSILLTTPLSCAILTFTTPLLLSKPDHPTQNTL